VVRKRGLLPLTEYRRGDEVHFFSYAELARGMGELGYTSFKEMQSVRVLGLEIERDRHFEPCPLSTAKTRAGL
jgi:hypothetical protein